MELKWRSNGGKMIKINILIVEDEAIVALEIKRSVIKLGYSVIDTISNYDEALQSIKNKTPDIILLDINLNNSKDGIELAQAVAKQSPIPIIYLTAFSDDTTIQRAIETNPIGYLVKPFKREDLKSTLQLAIYKLNTNYTKKHELIDIGDGYLYDMRNHNLFFQDYPIKLSLLEQKLLEILIEAKGEMVPFSVLEEHIWGGKPISSSSLRTLLYRLRGKLEYKLIETVPSFGIKFKI